MTGNVEVSRREYGDFAVCPYAKPERVGKKLKIGVFDISDSTIVQLIDGMLTEGYESALYAVFEGGVPVELNGGKDTIKFANFMKQQLKDSGHENYTVICFNPNDKVCAGNYNIRSESPYFLLNVAKKKILHEARKKLQKTKYYDNFSEEYKKMLGIK